MPTLSNLIDDKQLLDFSQHFGVQRNFMGSRLFPDQKTQYIEQEYTRACENGTLPMVAKVHALDTEAYIGSRTPFEKVSIEELLIKEKINLSENVALFEPIHYVSCCFHSTPYFSRLSLYFQASS